MRIAVGGYGPAIGVGDLGEDGFGMPVTAAEADRPS
jgi:hypothetical protein